MAQGRCTHPGAKSAWHMGQLRRVCAPSTAGCSWVLGTSRDSGAVHFCGDWAGDPGGPPAPRSTRQERPGLSPPPGAGGKGVQEKVLDPTVKTSGDAARSGSRPGSCETRSLDGVSGAPARSPQATPSAPVHAPGRGKRAAAAARRPRSGPRLPCAAARTTAAHTRRRRPGGTRGGGSGAWGDTRAVGKTPLEETQRGAVSAVAGAPAGRAAPGGRGLAGRPGARSRKHVRE